MAISVAAQGGEFEVGGVAGYGGVIGEDVRDQSYGYGGAFFQTRLGRPEVKVDYEYHAWDRLGPLHMIGVGWLIQAKPRRIRPFFQVGWVWAFERHRVRGTFPGRLPDDPSVFVDRSMTETLQGLALGAGVTLDVGNRRLGVPEWMLRYVPTRRGAWFVAARRMMPTASSKRTLLRYGFVMPSDLAAGR